MATGTLALPVSVEAVIDPAAPTFAVATENAPVPVVPGMTTIPSLVTVAAIAMISGTGLADAEKSSVLTPTMGATGAVFAQAKLKVTSVGAMAPAGVRAMTKLWAPPAGMAAGTLGAPVS